MKLNNHNFIVRLMLAICNAWIWNTGCGWKLSGMPQRVRGSGDILRVTSMTAWCG